MLWPLLSFLTLVLNALDISAMSNVSCLPFYNWTYNSQTKSPCEVASILLSECNNGPFPVDALPQSSHYVGPSIQNANPCQCNTVTYSLMSACGACQGRTYLSWSVWSANCGTVYDKLYPEPIPSDITIPGWAYLDVKGHDNFDQSNARQNANLTESSPILTPTITIAKTTQATSIIFTPTQQAPASSNPSSSAAYSTNTIPDRNVNAVVGVVVGGLLGLSLLFGLFYWYFRRNRIAGQGAQLASPTYSNSPNDSWHREGPYTRQIIGSAPQISALAVASLASLNSLPVPATYTLDPSVSGSADSVPMGSSHV